MGLIVTCTIFSNLTVSPRLRYLPRISRNGVGEEVVKRVDTTSQVHLMGPLPPAHPNLLLTLPGKTPASICRPRFECRLHPLQVM